VHYGYIFAIKNRVISLLTAKIKIFCSKYLYLWR